MAQCIKSGNLISLAELDSVTSKLPAGTYNLDFDPRSGFKLFLTEDFILPEKIYGDMSLVDRAIKVYKNKDRNFGLLLSGLRGAGKTLLMKKIAVELKQPIIIINNSFSDYSGELIKFLTNPALGDCTILFDEFEKHFDREDPTPLTLLDGPYDTHHFYILTVNDVYISENLTNRPGRIYYHQCFSGLEDEMIYEVGADLLKDKTMINDLVDACSDIHKLSFDMLISIINDCNLFNESPKTCIKFFGFNATNDSMYIKVYQYINGDKIEVYPECTWQRPTDRYTWLEKVHYMLNNNTEQKDLDIKLDLTKMVKLSKNKYKYVYTLSLNDLDEEDEPLFKPQDLVFEILFSNQPPTPEMLF